jgi:hypothetical protein
LAQIFGFAPIWILGILWIILAQTGLFALLVEG